MPVFDIPRPYPQNARYEDRVRNGKQPDWRSPSLAIARVHYALAHCRKLVFHRSQNAINVSSGAAGTTVQWRWLFRTGENSQSGNTIKLRARAVMLPADNTSSTDPRIQITCGGLTSDEGRYALVDTTPTGDQLQVVDIVTESLVPNTEYECHVDVIDYARLVGLTCWEEVSSGVQDAADHGTDLTSFGLDAEITDAQHSDLVLNTHEIWKHNGAHLLSLVPAHRGVIWSRSTASYVNLLDQSVSAHSASSLGCQLWNRFKNAVHTDDVNCVFGAYGVAANTAGGDIKLVDSSGDVASLGTFSTSGEWKTTTFTLDGSVNSEKLDLHFQNSGGAKFDRYRGGLHLRVRLMSDSEVPNSGSDADEHIQTARASSESK